jgi:hypothetical protein
MEATQEYIWPTTRAQQYTGTIHTKNSTVPSKAEGFTRPILTIVCIQWHDMYSIKVLDLIW